MKKPIPRYVSLEGTELVWTGKCYYRMAGGWGVLCYWDGDILKASSDDKRLKHVNGIVLTPSTYKKFKKDNGKYINEGYEEEHTPLVYDYERKHKKRKKDTEIPF